jgi:hypothetical protein
MWWLLRGSTSNMVVAPPAARGDDAAALAAVCLAWPRCPCRCGGADALPRVRRGCAVDGAPRVEELSATRLHRRRAASDSSADRQAAATLARC